MLKYQFALDERGKVIDIKDVPEEGHLNRSFTCIGCHEPMLAAIGTERRYFRHKTDDSSCNKETYLHKLAKLVFQI